MVFDWATQPPYDGGTVDFIETYRGYDIYFLSHPGLQSYGMVDPAGNELLNIYPTVEGARGHIDNLLDNPIFVQNYPPISPTHVDPGWIIVHEPAGEQRIYAIDQSGIPVSAFWVNTDLSGLLAWMDQTYVTTGHVLTHMGIPITFYLSTAGLFHVYEATVGVETSRFDNWRLQDCLNWIETEPPVPPPPTDIKSIAIPGIVGIVLVVLLRG